MAFFKFRLTGSTGETQTNGSNSPAESVDAMRRRARHRLLGASVLVVLGVVGFPLLFDTQPRPVSVDIAVDIPDRANSKPLVDTSKQKPLSAAAGLDAKEEVVPDAKSEAKSEIKADNKPESKAETKAELKSEVKTESKTDAKLEVKPAAAAVAIVAPKSESKPDSVAKDSTQRFVVQVGAFSDDSKVREVRAKVEKEGLKTYTNVAQTKDGARTRVRLGPFNSRDEADKVARKIKQLQLQPQVLAL